MKFCTLIDSVSSLLPLFEMSTKDFQLNRVTSYHNQFGSDPTRLHETFLGSHPNGITLESDPVWVRIADPNGFGSIESRVNARPIRYSLGMDPFGSDPISCKRGLRLPKMQRGLVADFIRSQDSNTKSYKPSDRFQLGIVYDPS